MSSLILIDANVLMYAAGREHPHKPASRRWLESAARGEVDAAVDAEVLQEILHRYRSIGRWEQGRTVYDFARAAFPQVLAITDRVLDEARRLLDLYEALPARDALHVAVVRLHGAEAICSYDRHFDVVTGLKRIEPA